MNEITQQESRKVLFLTKKWKPNIQVCHCGGKYVPTKTSKDKCLFCYWKKAGQTGKQHYDSGND